VSENGRLGPFLNPLSGLGFGPNPNGLGYTIDPNPAHYNSRKKERRSSEFSSQLSTNQTKEKEGAQNLITAHP